MTYLWVAVPMTLAGVWIITGRDPIYWLIRALIHVRAGLANAAIHQVEAWRRWAATHRQAVAVCESEISGGTE